MVDVFDNFLKTNKNPWYIYSSCNKIVESNGDISWTLQDSHSGPLLKVNFNSFSGLYSTEINDYFYHFGNINPELFENIIITEFNGGRIMNYQLRTNSVEVLIRFLFK